METTETIWGRFEVGAVRIVDEVEMQKHRDRRRCEWCGRSLHYQAHPHHIFSRGAGRLDIPTNLVALGGFYDCNCHGESHNGNEPTRAQLIALVARREGVTEDALIAEINRLRALDKDGKPIKRMGQ